MAEAFMNESNLANGMKMGILKGVAKKVVTKFDTENGELFKIEEKLDLKDLTSEKEGVFNITADNFKQLLVMGVIDKDAVSKYQQTTFQGKTGKTIVSITEQSEIVDIFDISDLEADAEIESEANAADFEASGF